MKKLLTIFLLLIICIQCLPVKELGKCLFDNNFVEEETCKKPCNEKDGVYEAKEMLFANATQDFSGNIDHLKIIPSVHLHAHPVTEVTTPPPNA
jgi:hypothetical protein